jgi:hypothetical protein
MLLTAGMNIYSQTTEDKDNETLYQKLDYDRIKQNIENTQSNFHYAKLWNRYQQGDSTLTLEEKQHLYYGYVFHKDYDPFDSGYDEYDRNSKINTILSKEKPTNKEWKQLISSLDEALSVEPFNCKCIYYQMVAYNALKQTADFKKNAEKIKCVLEALVSTGDGLSKETAVHVIDLCSTSDYLYFNSLSMSYMSLKSGGYDVHYLEPNEYGLKELWFDVNKPYRASGDKSYDMFFKDLPE